MGMNLFRKLHVLWIRLIRSGSEWKNYTPAQKKLFEEIGIGDIVDAWMPLEAEQLSAVEESHQHRPYYVVRKKEDSLVCFYGTSRDVPGKRAERLLITAGTYNVWKNGFLCADRICEIPVGCLIGRLDTLREETMEEANRRIAVTKYRCGKKDMPMYPAAVPVRKGDIVRHGKENYYVTETGRMIHTVRLKKSGVCFRNRLMNGKDLDVSAVRVFENDADLQTVWICSAAQNALASLTVGSVSAGTEHKHADIQSLEEGHYYKYDVGSIFEESWSGSRYLYLFSRRGTDYGLSEEDCFADSLPVRKLHCENLSAEPVLADEDLVSYILNRLISCNEKQWGWLDELLVSA